MKGPKKVEPRSCSMIVVESPEDVEFVRFLRGDVPSFDGMEFPFAVVEIGGWYIACTMDEAEKMFKAPRASEGREVVYEQEYEVALQTGE